MRYDLSSTRYWRDLWTVPVSVLAVLSVVIGPKVLLIPAGFVLWTFLEYAVHRWVFHGEGKLSREHALHHRHPMEFIGAPPLIALNSGLLGVLASVFLPLFGLVLIGLLLGYLTYFLGHSAMHHAPPLSTHPLRHAWERHVRHHAGNAPCDFGIVFGFWDRVFGTRGTALRAGS